MKRIIFMLVIASGIDSYLYSMESGNRALSHYPAATYHPYAEQEFPMSYNISSTPGCIGTIDEYVQQIQQINEELQSIICDKDLPDIYADVKNDESKRQKVKKIAARYVVLEKEYEPVLKDVIDNSSDELTLKLQLKDEYTLQQLLNIAQLPYADDKEVVPKVKKMIEGYTECDCASHSTILEDIFNKMNAHFYTIGERVKHGDMDIDAYSTLHRQLEQCHKAQKTVFNDLYGIICDKKRQLTAQEKHDDSNLGQNSNKITPKQSTIDQNLEDLEDSDYKQIPRVRRPFNESLMVILRAILSWFW